jgi:hypothetical protein
LQLYLPYLGKLLSWMSKGRQADRVAPICSFCRRPEDQVLLIRSSSEADLSVCHQCISLFLWLIRGKDREHFDRITRAGALADQEMGIVPTRELLAPEFGASDPLPTGLSDVSSPDWHPVRAKRNEVQAERLSSITGRGEYRCSFCEEIRRWSVIAGPSVFICHECVGLILRRIRDTDYKLFCRLIAEIPSPTPTGGN